MGRSAWGTIARPAQTALKSRVRVSTDQGVHCFPFHHQFFFAPVTSRSETTTTVIPFQCRHSGDGINLRDRFLLTVIVAQYISGWRSVMKWIYHELEAQVIYSLMTDRQPVIYWATNHLLARISFDSNTREMTKK